MTYITAIWFPHMTAHRPRTPGILDDPEGDAGCNTSELDLKERHLCETKLAPVWRMRGIPGLNHNLQASWGSSARPETDSIRMMRTMTHDDRALNPHPTNDASSSAKLHQSQHCGLNALESGVRRAECAEPNVSATPVDGRTLSTVCAWTNSTSRGPGCILLEFAAQHRKSTQHSEIHITRLDLFRSVTDF